MPSDPHAHFPVDYLSARRAFLAAAEAAGAVLASHPLQERGAHDEELAVDVAYIGPDTPDTLLAISSGIHGVEGFAGSGLQHQLLAEQLAGLDLPFGMGLLAVHAINPYGFSALRRVNESNVDLNRNFLRHPEGHVANPGYDSLYPAINPDHLDEASERESRRAMGEFAKAHGIPRLQEVLTCGQYLHPSGVQFGGVRDERSNRALRDIAARETRGARRVGWIDVHTGLGPYGVPEMITEAAPDQPVYARGRAWYGDLVRSTDSGESASAALHGVMEGALAEALPAECELTAFAAEFGTYEPSRVFWAMRADNWLHAHGERDSEQGRSIKREMLEVFRPADRSWQGEVLERGARLIQQARTGLVEG